MAQPTVPPTAATAPRPLAFGTWVQRTLAAASPARRLSPAEIKIAASSAAELDFVPLVPSAVPIGYRLTASEPVPYCRTLATFLFEGAGMGHVRLTEQLTSVAVDLEAAASRFPHTRQQTKKNTYNVIYGAFDGTEPIDGLHWHENRRVVTWYEDDVLCTLTLYRGRALSVWRAIRMADSMVPVAALVGRRGSGGGQEPGRSGGQ